MIEPTPMTAGRIASRKENIPSSTALQKVPVNTLWLLGFVFLHIPLGWLVLQMGSVVATAHALFTILLGLFFLSRDRHPARVIYVAAYITGAEVLWRAAGARIFWETGKFAVSALLLLALLKYGRSQKIARWPFFYFVFLLPSILIIPYFDREAIAFNLAGPFALAIAVMFFGMVRIDLKNFKNILIAMLAPTIALATYVLGKIVTSQNIVFGTGSNLQTSGDFGPNQVSTILALGGLAAIYYALVENNLLYRYLFLGLSLWLMAQSALTFSRSGVWTTALAVFITGLYLMRDSRRRVGLIFVSIVFGVLVNFVIFPFLNTFTGNTLSARFANTQTTGRLEIIQADLMVFQMYPLFGVGPNQSIRYHALTFRSANAHTEYSRMLSEHGIFGLVALFLLVQGAAWRFFAKGDSFSKAFLLGIIVWALLYMFNAATRLVVPSFLFGLAAATFVLQEKPEVEEPRPLPAHAGRTAKYRVRGWK
jgi:O-antigen ligase